MPGVVADERQLREHHGQQNRDQQLPPRAAQEREPDPRSREHRQVRGDHRGVLAAAAAQQPGFANFGEQAALPRRRVHQRDVADAPAAKEENRTPRLRR
ncbi:MULTISPECIES: hypothetical protein [Amycolatopsis]|uniref:hypothetical protein n=1 Tax=Amycolatopsis TaxID=1813 RepID=UPI00082EC0FF|nr:MULTISPECIES: hypothetical protein [Amycolatopsis]